MKASAANPIAVTQDNILVTGASSGLGLEAAAQFAEAGSRRVVVACRSLEKATVACALLAARTGRSVFEPLELDLGELESVRRASRALATEAPFDVLVLNAGVLPGSALIRTADAIEETASVSLVRHHVLTLGLLDAGLLSVHGRVVIAGSEGARGDAPGMKPTDIRRFAADHFAGNLEEAVRCLITLQPPASHHWSTTYCTAKALVALWATALAPRLPRGLTVNVVSPGNAPATNAARRQPWYFRAMICSASVLGPRLGMAASVAVGARRYLDAAAFGDDETGAFFASPPGKLVGHLTRQELPHLSDPDLADACLRAVVGVSRQAVPARA